MFQLNNIRTRGIVTKDCIEKPGPSQSKYEKKLNDPGPLKQQTFLRTTT